MRHETPLRKPIRARREPAPVERAIAWVCAGALLLMAPTTAAGLDTVEPFDVGALDLELYASLETTGGAAGELVVGYGLLPGLSMTIAGAFEASEGVSPPSLSFTLFGAPVSMDHVSLDLSLGAETGPGGLLVMPEVELNLDLDPHQGLLGVYVHAGADLRAAHRVPVAGQSARDEPIFERVEASVGGYVAVGNGHQLLLQGTALLLTDPRLDSVALGYNVALTGTVELITEVSAVLPVEGAATSFGAVVGVIATPSPGGA